MIFLGRGIAHGGGLWSGFWAKHPRPAGEAGSQKNLLCRIDIPVVQLRRKTVEKKTACLTEEHDAEKSAANEGVLLQVKRVPGKEHKVQDDRCCKCEHDRPNGNFNVKQVRVFPPRLCSRPTKAIAKKKNAHRTAQP